METSRSGSRATLDALLKQRQWERDALAIEAAQAQRILEERARAHEAVLTTIAGTQSRLRELYRAQSGFPPEQRRLLEVFLKDQYQVAQARQEAAASARVLHAQVIAQLERSRVAVKMLERYGERKATAQKQGELRTELRAADDMWLLRRGRK
jgi:flagellar biosynthesis chaperone FliJ